MTPETAKKIRNENARFRRALKFYADHLNWESTRYLGESFDPPIADDAGAKARRALEPL